MFFKKKTTESLISEFEKLMKARKEDKALSIIEEIVNINPLIQTSQFNYGICLSKLGRYEEAATAFLKAYEIDNSDGRALYRGCLSVAYANNSKRLYEVFKKELEWNPDMINNFLEVEEFEKFFEMEEFTKLKDEYKEYIGRESEE